MLDDTVLDDISLLSGILEVRLSSYAICDTTIEILEPLSSYLSYAVPRSNGMKAFPAVSYNGSITAVLDSYCQLLLRSLLGLQWIPC